MIRVIFFLPLLAVFARAIEPGLHSDIEYAQAGGVSLKLDVSVPAGDGPFPVAILVHGGGWGSGDKANVGSVGGGADISPWFSTLTDAKFTWFSINYRLAPAHRWPAQIDDVRTAIRWIKAHAAEYKGDPTRIALFGHSAGGHLSMFAGMTADDHTRVQALVGYAPVTDFEYELPVRKGIGLGLRNMFNVGEEPTGQSLAMLRAASPINVVKPGLPPVLLLHGTGDKTVPYPTSLNLQARLRAAGVRCDLIALPGAPHGLLTWEKFLPDYKQQLIAWLRENLKPATP
jgi:alpha-L-fucosidase 2